MTFCARSATSGNTGTQYLSSTGLIWLNCHSRRTPTFRRAGFQRDLAMGPCTRCWSVKLEKLDCLCTGRRTFPTLDWPWRLPSGHGNINHTFFLSYTRNSLKRTLYSAKTLRIGLSLTAMQVGWVLISQFYMQRLPMAALHDPSPRPRWLVANTAFKERLPGSSTNN